MLDLLKRWMGVGLLISIAIGVSMDFGLNFPWWSPFAPFVAALAFLLVIIISAIVKSG
ncbi:hypothetical protein [Xanthomonas hortorum]|uniref:hypothetical protein n=1 Tax=Xanthomonas hortorum TaxID=56454 RepID=UPI001459411A|nr:hypothetical protein [Xanthomonas hortorum]MCM5524320.1 hypothetical protein [Xanthomonas hortorum pv. pelargonii]MCM5536778.1 hypothetical protein [Xanthomonas hortorum pv. pelargonii]MCM5541058.1 hypothetical protein [Xanthomonas hortorum pv. pelargonii]MCM5544381.1 hypothetical protein [Xanthomonas hortorum pv. pelargonii]MCM5562567.1 hypothetical protein [Xanthomonas hortorum pv. pelargonii]